MSFRTGSFNTNQVFNVSIDVSDETHGLNLGLTTCGVRLIVLATSAGGQLDINQLGNMSYWATKIAIKRTATVSLLSLQVLAEDATIVQLERACQAIAYRRFRSYKSRDVNLSI